MHGPLRTRQALKSLMHLLRLHKGKPNIIQTDKGTEFINSATKALFKQYSIKWFTTQNETKAQIVERFNRTLKERMYKYFTARNTKRWVDVLADLVYNYNTSYHRSIKMTPIEASKAANADTVAQNLYGVNPKHKPAIFAIGDHVRISKYKNKFAKGYTPNYTNELFVIDQIHYTTPITYSIHDMNGEKIVGTFYKEELSLYYI